MTAALPPSVAALAKRLGARMVPGGRAEFRQSGALRGLGQKGWMRFSASQAMESGACAFRWRARVGPLGLVHVTDALVDGEPVSGAKALGLVPLGRAEPTHELVEGQLQRYLAELAWNPDAILANPALCWEVRDDTSFAVSARIGAVEGAIELHLDDQGLPARTFALRPAREGKAFVRRGWHGAFADHREIEGRMIPQEGRVAWDYEGERFEVWRGRLESWRVVPTKHVG